MFKLNDKIGDLLLDFTHDEIVAALLIDVQCQLDDKSLAASEAKRLRLIGAALLACHKALIAQIGESN